MIDIHTHILPGIDDGSGDFNQSLLMAGEAYNAGFTDIITTSHYMTNVYETNSDARFNLISEFQSLLNKNKININIYNGAEIYFSEEFPDLIANGTIPTLAGSQYILFELPLSKNVTYIDSVIFKLKRMGYKPIIAHPERYQIVQDNFELANEWISYGALLQCNYGSMIDVYGKSARKVLLKLLKNHMVTFLGSDNHRAGAIYAAMPKIVDKLKKKIGEDYFYELSEANPRKIIENDIIE